MGGTRGGLKIAILSTPSVFLALREQKAPFFDDCVLFEFDHRFDVFQHQFEHFDYRDATGVMEKFENFFDLVYVDPPFRETVCVQKNMEVVNTIAKVRTDGVGKRIIFCTGLKFEDVMGSGA